jgi:hypothetical protein
LPKSGDCAEHVDAAVGARIRQVEPGRAVRLREDEAVLQHDGVLDHPGRSGIVAPDRDDHVAAAIALPHGDARAVRQDRPDAGRRTVRDGVGPPDAGDDLADRMLDDRGRRARERGHAEGNGRVPATGRRCLTLDGEFVQCDRGLRQDGRCAGEQQRDGAAA